MNKQYLISWLLIGFLVGLGFGTRAVALVSSMTPEVARWSILLTLSAAILLLATLWRPLEPYPLWARFASLLAISGWVALVAGYPLWGGGEFYGLGWTFSVYLVTAGIVFEFYRQARRRPIDRPILAWSRIVPAVIACVSLVHLLVYQPFHSPATLVLLFVTVLAGLTACAAGNLSSASTSSA